MLATVVLGSLTCQVTDELGSRVIRADEAGLGPREAFVAQAPAARYILTYHVK
jgi:hypothetical protein